MHIITLPPHGCGKEPVRSAQHTALLGNCWFPPGPELILGGGQVKCPSFWLLSAILTSHPVGTRIQESGAPDSPAVWPGPRAKGWALPSVEIAQGRPQSFAAGPDSVTWLLWASVASPTHRVLKTRPLKNYSMSKWVDQALLSLLLLGLAEEAPREGPGESRPLGLGIPGVSSHRMYSCHRMFLRCWVGYMLFQMQWLI